MSRVAGTGDVPATVQTNSVNLLRGLGLNGQSQAVAYGDDFAAATNYPLVRLTASDGRTYYCKTAGHTLGIATGTNIISTTFFVPPTVPLGNAALCVVANGIGSATVATRVTL